MGIDVIIYFSIKDSDKITHFLFYPSFHYPTKVNACILKYGIGKISVEWSKHLIKPFKFDLSLFWNLQGKKEAENG